jgi:hypothetical protein
LKGNFEEPVAVLFASFKKWAELMSEPPLSSKAFSSKPFYAFDFVPVPFCSFRDSRSISRPERAGREVDPERGDDGKNAPERPQDNVKRAPPGRYSVTIK